MTLAACQNCVLDRLELRRSIHKAEALLRRGLSITVMQEQIDRLKLRIDACDCEVTELKPMRQPRPKAQPKAKKVKQPRPLPSPDEIQAAIDAATAKTLARTKTKSRRPGPTGECHTCGRAVTGERRYCGPCAAAR